MFSSTLPLDTWSASSLLQKSIRRGSLGDAQVAADALMRWRGNRIWQRLLLIAVEDVGVADLELLVDLVGVAAQERPSAPARSALVLEWVQHLVDAQKDRSADYLICSAMSHPDWSQDRAFLGDTDVSALVHLATQGASPLARRTVAAWLSCGYQGHLPFNALADAPVSLLSAFVRCGMWDELAAAIFYVLKRTKEPIAAMLPLLWHMRQGDRTDLDHPTPTVPSVSRWRGLPLYTFDKHTRLGKAACGMLLRRCPQVQDTVFSFVPAGQAHRVVEMAALYVDAVPVANRLAWKYAVPLEILGREADFWKVGCPRDGIAPIFEVVKGHLDQLDACRVELLDRAWVGK